MTVARGVLVAAAATVVAVGLSTVPAAPDWHVPLAVAVACLAQLLRFRFRSGSRVVYVAWGEAALIASLYLAPAGWTPAAFAVGSTLAVTLLALARRSRPTLLTVDTVTILTLASAAGAGVCRLVADPYRGPVDLTVLAALLLGAVAYLLATLGLTSVVAAVRDGAQPWHELRQSFGRKGPLFAGNVVVGLVAVVLVDEDWRWLAGLPLVLALVHTLYASRMRAVERRRVWNAFARATRALNQPGQTAVAEAAVRGALEVFAVGHAELELTGPDGVRRWVGDQTGAVRLVAPDTGPAPQGVAVPLVVGGLRIGTLRVLFPRGAGPASGDESALQAYADAVAAAVQDSATHAELHQLLARSAYEAQHDPLTGLLNRAALMARGETTVQLLPSSDPVVLLLIDVDHFREINDTLGHSAGDEVLKVTAERLRAAMGAGELLARLGGDEFALLYADTAHDDGVEGARQRAVARARTLVERLAAPARIRGVSVAVEASVGVVVAPAGTAEVSELLRRAAAALAQGRAKEGSGVVSWYQGEQDPVSTDRPALLAELREALERDELTLLLQPVVDLRTGTPIGLEALVRWLHPRRGVLVPADFVRVVENSDLLSTFTEYVLDKALATAARLAPQDPPLPVAVNLSARSLLDPRLASSIGALLRRHGIPGDRLILEITETVMTRELPGIEEALAQLRALGVRLAVDDFGTGYASLTFLTRVPLDEVKVDGALVAQMSHSPEAEAIVRTTVELGRELGLRVVAEGVETADQHAMLTRIGCVAAQGFHFAEPMPEERLPCALQKLGTGRPAVAPD